MENRHLIPCSRYLKIKCPLSFKKTSLFKSHSGSESLFLMRPKEFVTGNEDSLFLLSLVTKRKVCKVSQNCYDENSNYY